MYVSRISLLSLSIGLAVTLPAQQSQTASGPTLQQTIDFINEQKQLEELDRGGPLTIDRLPGGNGCSVYRDKIDGSRLTLLLSDTDPNNLSIEKVDGINPLYVVSAQRIKTVKTWPHVEKYAGAALLDDEKQDIRIWGYIQSIQQNVLNAVVFTGEVLVAKSSGQLLTKTIVSTDHFQRRKDFGFVDIKADEIEPGELFISSAHVGRKGRSDGRMFRVGLSQQSGQTLFASHERDRAERLAKAFVHAIVLCHKDDKPSLF